MRAARIAMALSIGTGLWGLKATAQETPTSEDLMLTAPAKTTLDADRIEVPMVMRGTMPAVEVRVNGKGPFLFAIDTGGQGTCRADTSLVETLELPIAGQIAAGDGTGQNRRMMDVVELDSITVGGARFEKLSAPSRDYNRRVPGRKIQGILGIHLFAECLLTLDYGAKKVVIEKGELPPPDDSSGIFALDDSAPTPAIFIRVGGGKVQAHIDSGNMGGLMLPASLIQDLSFQSEPRVVGRARTVTNEFEIKAGTLNESIFVGKHELKTPQVSFSELFQHANIGSRVLAGFVTTYDMKQGRVRFVRADG